MKVGRVVSTVVATIEHDLFAGHRLLLCDVLDGAGEPDGSYLIAVDYVGAGAGETVLILDEGTSARQIAGLDAGPLRTVIVGIVDQVAGAGGAWELP